MRISDWSSDVCSSDLTQTIIHSAIIIRDWFGPNSGPDILKDNMPIILPGYRYGAAATQRGNSIQVDLYAGGEDNALFMYLNARFRADVASLAGRMHDAQAERRRDVEGKGVPDGV